MNDVREMYESAGIEPDVYDFCDTIQKGLKERFERIDAVAEYNQMKVIRAMEKQRVSAACFESTTGYGYDPEKWQERTRTFGDSLCVGEKE